MSLLLFGLTFILAVFHWVTVYKHWHKAELFFKPAVMASLFAALLAASPGLANGLGFFAAAVIFSLVGDVLLLFPSRFTLGLAMFLGAHVFYIAAFNIPLMSPNPAIIGLAFFVAIPAAFLYRRIRAGLLEKKLRRLRKPVLAYLVVLSVMLLSGLATLLRVDWPIYAALLAAGGALLFAVSDTLLAWNKFVRPLRTRRVGYMIAYHLGQIAIIAGAILRDRYF